MQRVYQFAELKSQKSVSDNIFVLIYTLTQGIYLKTDMVLSCWCTEMFENSVKVAGSHKFNMHSRWISEQWTCDIFYKQICEQINFHKTFIFCWKYVFLNIFFKNICSIWELRIPLGIRENKIYILTYKKYSI